MVWADELSGAEHEYWQDLKERVEYYNELLAEMEADGYVDE